MRQSVLKAAAAFALTLTLLTPAATLTPFAADARSPDVSGEDAGEPALPLSETQTTREAGGAAPGGAGTFDPASSEFPPAIEIAFTDRDGNPIPDSRIPEGSEAFCAVKLSASVNTILTVTVKTPDGSPRAVTVPAEQKFSERVEVIGVRPDDVYKQGDESLSFDVTGVSGGNFAAPPTLGGGTLTVYDTETPSYVTLELRTDGEASFNADGTLPEGSGLKLAVAVDCPPLGGSLTVDITLPDGSETVATIDQGRTERVIDVSDQVRIGDLAFRITDTGGVGKSCYEKLVTDDSGGRVTVTARDDKDKMLYVTLFTGGGNEIGTGAVWQSGGLAEDDRSVPLELFVTGSVGGPDSHKTKDSELWIRMKGPKSFAMLYSLNSAFSIFKSPLNDPEFDYYWIKVTRELSAGQAFSVNMRIYRMFPTYVTPHGAEAEIVFEAFYNPDGRSFDLGTTDGLLPFSLMSGDDARTAATFSAITDLFDWNFKTTATGAFSDMTLSHTASTAGKSAKVSTSTWFSRRAEAAGVVMENVYALTTSPGNADPAHAGLPYLLITPGAFFDADGAIPLIDKSDADTWERADRAVRADASVMIGGEAYVTAFTLKNTAPERLSGNASWDVPGSRFAWNVNIRGGAYNRPLLNAEVAPGKGLTFYLRSISGDNRATAAVAFLSGGAVTTGPKTLPAGSLRSAFTYTRADCGCGSEACDCGEDCDCEPGADCGCKPDGGCGGETCDCGEGCGEDCDCEPGADCGCKPDGGCGGETCDCGEGCGEDCDCGPGADCGCKPDGSSGDDPTPPGEPETPKPPVPPGGGKEPDDREPGDKKPDDRSDCGCGNGTCDCDDDCVCASGGDCGCAQCGASDPKSNPPATGSNPPAGTHPDTGNKAPAGRPVPAVSMTVPAGETTFPTARTTARAATAERHTGLAPAAVPGGAATRGDANAAGLRTLKQNGAVIMNLGGLEIPLFGPLSLDTWALANLILSAFAIVLIPFAFRRRHGNAQNGSMGRFSALFGGAAPILFIFTEDVRNLMTLFDVWTLPTLLLAVIQVAMLSLSSKGRAGGVPNRGGAYPGIDG